MAAGEVENPEKSLVQRYIPRRKRWRFFLSLGLLLLIAIAVAWTQREDIADNIIADQLDQMGLPATYEIERIGGTRQVVRNIVVGDPAAPDLTIDRATVILRYRLGTPAIGRVEVEGARLYGTWRNGELSFGSLDPVLFAESDEPPGLPDLDLKLVDARALIETDYGPAGFKAEGEGELDDGFEGIIAGVAPELSGPECSAQDASLYGRITTGGGQPRFAGPVRLGGLSCPGMPLALRQAAVEVDVATSDSFDRFDGEGRFSTAALAYGESRAGSSSGRIEASWADDALNARYSLAGRGVSLPQAQLALVTAEGAVRARDGFRRAEVDAEIEGDGLRIGRDLDDMLAGAIESGEGTLLAPLLQRMRQALRREQRGSELAATLSVRRTGEVINLVMPSASLRGGSGSTLLSLSRVQLSTAGAGAPRFSGNISTGGEGLPRISGRMERRPGGDAIFRLRMAQYRAGESALQVPELIVAQSSGGTLGFSGRVIADGPLPGGSARNLRLPVSGNWSAGGGLSLWRRCTEIGFDRLELASLRFENRAVTLCPSPQGAIVRYDGAGLRVAAGAPRLDLAGYLADTPIRIASGPIGFAYPGVMTARDLDVALGPAGTASNFRVSNLQAELGGSEIAGSFTEADVRLDAVPLDVLNADGNWRYADEVLTLSDGAFRVVDREIEHRFEPLISRDATLTLEDNVIRASATLREPRSDRAITDVAMVHDLSSGRGHADLLVDNLVFDDRLQPGPQSSVCVEPDMPRPQGGSGGLSCLAYGVIANARGSVSGAGRIDWNETEVTSSGEFSTDGLDFAAAFGPVRGARGTIRFTDLLALTTAPGQKLRVASVNPGIEVLDGEIEFALRDGQFLSVAGGSWPFMGGRLILQSTDLNFGIEEERRYVFRIEGLEAGQFIQQMELGNIDATGTFDGIVPIVFDAQGNGRIENGALDSRPPGGNVSYVGELTYEDMGAITNFAFSALRSLDYRTMTIRMEGPLTGEIVTRVRLDGVSQGAGTTQNFITRRIAALPIRFNINVRAPFYKLINDIKYIYDPVTTMDPGDLQRLLDGELPGNRLIPSVPDAVRPEDLIPDEPPIQPEESESVP